MGENVISLWGGPTGELTPNPTLIEELERLLAAARSGQVIGVAAAMLHHDGLGSYRLAGTVGGYSMLGALEMVGADLRQILRDMD